MSMKIRIRRAETRDVPEILQVTKEAFGKYAFDLGMPEKVKALNESEASILRDMENKNVLVGELDDVLVGSIRFEFLQKRLGYFSRFSVKLHAQSCGMGGMLVNEVIRCCEKEGIEALSLHTSAKMFSLIRFYYGKGFFVHSTSTDRGYVRAFLVKELCGRDTLTDYSAFLPAGY